METKRGCRMNIAFSIIVFIIITLTVEVKGDAVITSYSYNFQSPYEYQEGDTLPTEVDAVTSVYESYALIIQEATNIGDTFLMKATSSILEINTPSSPSQCTARISIDYTVTGEKIVFPYSLTTTDVQLSIKVRRYSQSSTKTYIIPRTATVKVMEIPMSDFTSVINFADVNSRVVALQFDFVISSDDAVLFRIGTISTTNVNVQKIPLPLGLTGSGVTFSDPPSYVNSQDTIYLNCDQDTECYFSVFDGLNFEIDFQTTSPSLTLKEEDGAIYTMFYNFPSILMGFDIEFTAGSNVRFGQFVAGSTSKYFLLPFSSFSPPISNLEGSMTLLWKFYVSNIIGLSFALNRPAFVQWGPILQVEDVHPPSPPKTHAAHSPF